MPQAGTVPDPRPRTRSLKARLYHILEAGKTTDRASLIFDVSMTLLILANVVAFALETVEDIGTAHAVWFDAFNLASVAIFTVEYVLRLWVCTEHRPYARLGAAGARLRFAATPMMVIDLLAILPFYLSFLLPIDLRVLRVFRMLRFFKLARYSPALDSINRVMWQERRALGAAIIVMTGALLVSSTLLYFIEREAQPEAFGSVPAAMWWSMATLTTVGYGDVVPVTVAGRMVGALVMLFGLGMFALPIGIIATGFSHEIHRREFAVTWGMVARVPLFANLDAEQIFVVMGSLEAVTLPRGTHIAHAGDEADAMYFIVSGEVTVERGQGALTLTEGDFFGEIALLQKARRQHTLIVSKDTNLLKLSADDFAVLSRRHPEIRESVLAVARERAWELEAFSETEELEEAAQDD
ncbi:cyclic nucleotide-gated ion channel [Pyruvatibacter mobilis]|jgi:voltage-gated potassium channel|uniref:cyclic nucleotide-gated ion channel n=1 Tax=Pyruvatibacter mobilis TaxID=1712261 RepID=UPI003BA880B0